MGNVAHRERDLVIARALIDARAGVEHGALEAGLAEQLGDALGLLRLEAREQLGGRLKQQAAMSASASGRTCRRLRIRVTPAAPIEVTTRRAGPRPA